MKNKPFNLCVVGASNVDIHVRVQEELQNDTSTIGEIYLTSGGVGRNIVNGLAGLKIYVSFISVFSDDIFGDILLKDLKNQYISLENSLFHVGQTSKYVNIVTSSAAYGVNDIRSINELTASFFQQKLFFLCKMSYVIFDLNICDAVVDFITENVNTKLICEATSSIKCTKISKALDKLYILKANYKEGCIIAGCDQGVKFNELLDVLLCKGIKKVYITLGDKGALYADENIKLYANNQKIIKVSDTIGAGDAFLAGIMYGEVHHWTHEQTLIFCTKLCYSYLLSGQHIINSDIEQYALDPRNNIVNLLAWDDQSAQWIKIRKIQWKE